MNHNTKLVFIGLISAILMAGCQPPEPKNKDHIFKTQERVLENAKEVEAMLKENEQKKRQQIQNAFK